MRAGPERKKQQIATPLQGSLSVVCLMPRVPPARGYSSWWVGLFQNSFSLSARVSVPGVLHHQSFQLAAYSRRGWTVERWDRRHKMINRETRLPRSRTVYCRRVRVFTRWKIRETRVCWRYLVLRLPRARVVLCAIIGGLQSRGHPGRSPLRGGSGM